MNPGLKGAELLLIYRTEGENVTIKLKKTCHAILGSGTYCFEGIQMKEACVKESRKAIKCQECWHCVPPTKLKAKAKLPIHLISCL